MNQELITARCVSALEHAQALSTQANKLAEQHGALQTKVSEANGAFLNAQELFKDLYPKAFEEWAAEIQAKIARNEEECAE